ncbi:hypothetical protein ACOSP7_020506 [Xanthoceras sorbifolium]
MASSEASVNQHVQSSITPDSSLSGTKRKQNISEAMFKERTHQVNQYVARWVYEAGIPFNAIDNDSFKVVVEAVGQFGPGYKPPSQYQLREPLLKEEVERTKDLLKKQEEEWALNGCSIMMDTWSDRKRRSIMSLCVNCREGTTFLSSKESSDEAHTGEHIFQYVDGCIEQVGPQNVIQVVTDNATNNMAAAKLMKVKRPHIFWTSCATHNINLMLESIGKIQKFKKVIDQAKTFTIFIYTHHKTLSLMRSFTKKRDIVRPGVTKFASSFLTLQSLIEKKAQLRAMFTSDLWEQCKWSKTNKGKAAYSTIMSLTFWNGVTACLKVFSPLVNVLRLVDGDRKPSMGFVYGELLQAKEDIKVAMKNVEKNYRPIFDIIDARIKDRLDNPLHLTAYFLNPYYYYKDSNFQYDDDVNNAIFDCVKVFCGVDNLMLQSKVVNVEIPTYKAKERSFRIPLAVRGCERNDKDYEPAFWWSNYGGHTPNLQRMAIRILSLTTSSSRCEGNWSNFKGIHMKKMNRLDVNRLNDLVYVQFNAKLRNKQKRAKEKDVDVILARDAEATNAQEWIIEKGGGDDDEVEPKTGLTWQMIDDATGIDDIQQPKRSSRETQSELHEYDFVSEDEEKEENHDDFDFESDEERVMEEYGEEEFDPNA